MHAVGGRGEFDPPQFANRCVEILRSDDILISTEGGHQAGVAQSVDEARDATRVFKDRIVGVFCENPPALRTRYLETMIDIGCGFRFRECRQVKSQAHTLRQLYQFLRIELVVEFRLTRKDYP